MKIWLGSFYKRELTTDSREVDAMGFKDEQQAKVWFDEIVTQYKNNSDSDSYHEGTQTFTDETDEIEIEVCIFSQEI